MPRFLAIYTGQPINGAPPDEATIARGMQAWSDWMERHADRIVDIGGPLGRTKRVASDGVTDIRNTLAGYTVVEADNADAAARMFEGHPHFAVFPGDSVEVMPILPIPNG